jgi:hypothetical protein
MAEVHRLTGIIAYVCHDFSSVLGTNRTSAGRFSPLRPRGTLALSQKRIVQSDRIFGELTMATWIKCTNTKRMTVYINLDNAVTVMRDDTGQRIDERGTVIEFMGGEQVYIVVTEQPEEIIKLKSSA